MGRINWRRWNNILHRDIGYLSVGLTIIFAVSGIAVNHVADWNPNYSIRTERIQVKPLTDVPSEVIVPQVLAYLKINEKPQSSFRPSPSTVHIFFQGKTLKLNLASGEGEWEIVQERPILHDFNYLHLNHAKKWWTYFSDLYAAALLFLAISGLFVLKGKNGLSGRGKWLTGIGIVIPIIFLVIYKYM